METITRQIYFFKVHAQNSTFGEILDEVMALPVEEKCSEQGDDRKTFCDLSKKKGVYSGKVCAWRSSDFPSVASTDELNIYPLHLNVKDGLVEITHFIYFPEYDVLAIEYNYQGPRNGSLADHINNKLNNVGRPADQARFVVFEPLYDRDTLQQLDRMAEIRLVSMMVSKKHIEAIADLDHNLYVGFKSAAKVGESQEVEIILRPVPNGRKPVFSKDSLTSIVDQIKSFGKKHHINEVFDSFKMNALDTRTAKYHEFDMLKDKCVSEVKTMKQNSGRAVDSDDIFEKMTEAYIKNRDDLGRIANFE